MLIFNYNELAFEYFKNKTQSLDFIVENSLESDSVIVKTGCIAALDLATNTLVVKKWIMNRPGMIVKILNQAIKANNLLLIQASCVFMGNLLVDCSIDNHLYVWNQIQALMLEYLASPFLSNVVEILSYIISKIDVSLFSTTEMVKFVPLTDTW